MSGRRFNEKQVREILQKASAAQSPSPDGMSLEELKQVGSELGLDPGQIELAAQSVGSGPLSARRLPTGRLHFEQTVDGEIGPQSQMAIVGVLQRYYKKPGTLSQRGSNFDWIAQDDGSSMALTVTNKNGKAQIHLESNSWMGPFFTVVMVPVITMVVSFSLGKHGSSELVYLILALGALLTAGLIYYFNSSHKETVSGLMEKLVREAEVVEESNTLTSRLEVEPLRTVQGA